MKTTIHAKPNVQELFIERTFRAPRELVFRAFTDAELIVQWMGPREMSTEIAKLDNRTHGSWRIIHRDSQGNAYAFHGVIHEVCEPERIIRTFEFEGMPERGHVSLEVMTFEQIDGGLCKVTIQILYRSVQDRDGHIQSGMERGVLDSHSRLDDLLVRIECGAIR